MFRILRIIITIKFKAVLFHATKHDPIKPKYTGLFRIDYRERGFHARGLYPTQDTSSMGTARVKQEEEVDMKMQESSKKSGRKVGTKGKSPRTRPN